MQNIENQRDTFHRKSIQLSGAVGDERQTYTQLVRETSGLQGLKNRLNGTYSGLRELLQDSKTELCKLGDELERTKYEIWNTNLMLMLRYGRPI